MLASLCHLPRQLRCTHAMKMMRSRILVRCRIRLYSGPMYIKYNAALRGIKSQQMEGQWKELCLSNRYTTTLHVTNSGEHHDAHTARKFSSSLHILLMRCSGCAPVTHLGQSSFAYLGLRRPAHACLARVVAAVVKLGKLQSAAKVYRGVSGGVLPEEFWNVNAQNVRGGCEYGFLSTTLDRGVAMDYASSGKAGVVFEIQMGMIDRGANLSWLSQYPHEVRVAAGSPLAISQQPRPHVELISAIWRVRRMRSCSLLSRVSSCSRHGARVRS